MERRKDSFQAEVQQGNEYDHHHTQKDKKQKLIVIIGPTAVGKTKLSLSIAQQFNGEVISGDSMQVYRGMDIGTAKVTKEEMNGIPHHLIDILDPSQDFSVSDFQTLATEKIAEINRRNHIPLLVGGTGLYIQAVTHQFQFAENSHDESVRQKWEAYCQQHGADALHDLLKQKDPVYAQQVHPNNTRRVIRALEILEITGQSMADYQGQWESESPYDLVMIGLTMERERLYQRINQRVDMMIHNGLIDEVQALLHQGIPKNTTALQAIGYKEILSYLQGEISKEEAIELLKRNTRRFAKRQLTWFKRMKEMKWFDVSELSAWNKYEQIISHYIAGKYQ